MSKNSVQAWFICLLAAMFFFAESVRVNLFDTISFALMQQFHINAYAYGKLSAMYLLANILLLFPAGIILDKFQTRYVLFAALLVTIISTFAFYHTEDFLLARALMFLTGAGGAFCFIGAMRLAAQWFTSNKLAFVMAIVVTLGMIGGLCAQYPMQHFIMAMGAWQAAYKLIIGIEIVVAILVLVFVRNHSQDEMDGASVSTFFLNLKKVLRNKQTWVAGLYTSLLNLPITLLGAIWGQLFLVQARHFDQMSAASISSF
ncbi:MAG: MFS transporter [Gammaproteobacteria bacterium]|nr:MFS transporter [Gammaproteobacteria bacterium]